MFGEIEMEAAAGKANWNISNVFFSQK